MYGQEKINKIRLRFRRIFNGGIVLRNISYVYLILDGKGDPISLEIKWPRFELVSEETECKPVSKGFNEAVEYFEELPPFFDIVTQGRRGNSVAIQWHAAIFPGTILKRLF